MRPFPKLLLASLNRGKQEEFQLLLQPHGFGLGVPKDYVRNTSFLERVESPSPLASYEQNARSKCVALFRAAKVPTFADDSGLEVEFLKGKPGVQSARFGKPTARESQDQANRRQLLESLKGQSNRKAIFHCTLLFMVEGLELVAVGRCAGEIAPSEKGSGGFGYDSLFIPQGQEKTFAEMGEGEKNKFSHRALAVSELVRLMKERSIELVRP
jgi:XTP/dITP diphosphohydrolase